MGGGYYSHDVAMEARSTNRDVFSYAGYSTDSSAATARRTVHVKLNPYRQIRECMNTTPIVVALDVTRSRGDDSKIMYEKLPMFIGQIEMKGYVEGAAISFAAIGDASSGDSAPLQVGQFEADNRLDEVLSYFWLEEGGGGSGQESYELAAYYYARRSVLECQKQGRKGYFFFIGDEGFYPKVSKQQVKEILGVNIKDDIDSAKIFAELHKKYHVFFIYPQKSWQERKADIDAEIQQRVEAAGGQYKNVDIRASLIWNNRNDLDLHVIAPSGEEIYYGHKHSRCNGWLDVDMNVQGESLKPVENIRWAKGKAPKGKYKVFVQNYQFHGKKAPTEFRVEVEVAGEVMHFDGIVSPNGEVGGRSDVTVYEFDFDPDKPRVNEVKEEDESLYNNYHDDVIMDQWKSVLSPENILRIEDPHAIIDVMLGALSIVSGTNDLDEFLVDMKGRGQTAPRIEQTKEALLQLAQNKKALVKVEAKLPAKKSGKKRRGRSKRL
ncbi:YfaP family protein [Candidatus Uabimicrobium amorphum]|uniref:VWFA domain-containing protein n=1 Tax=Uabimicrobium amorphum TaxID=2596890 RepID=A0A5S9ISE5_UABAM|nr:hypothetical protein [Candidatus Uabimicrobium amorphum]BBM87288.1 hypothetical protein UABAM_05691 [Candidatus Uabimicrobium amorphum]